MPRKTTVEIGKRYGKLTVIQELGTYADSKNRKRLLWQCLCDCGKTTNLTSYRLITRTKSCGCLLFEHKDTYKGINNLSGRYWSSLRNGAKKRNLDFNITIEYAYTILEKQNFECALSKQKINVVRNPRLAKKQGIEQTASLDRIDPKFGYIEGNIQWLHKEVNFMKQDCNNQEMIKICHLIAQANPLYRGV